MDYLSNGAIYVAALLVLLTIVVFFHELGHFWVARRCGVKVDVFSIGFGSELLGFNDRHGTRWKISAIPLGGYVKMKGQSDTESVAQPEAAAANPEEQTQRQIVRDVLDRVFNGSAAKLVMQALAAGDTSAQELEEIQKLIDTHRKGRR